MKTSHLLLFLAALSVSACDFQAADEALGDFNIILGIEQQRTTIGVNLIDAGTGDFVSVPVTVTYPDGRGDLLVNAFGDPIGDTDKVDDGLFNFNVNNNRSLSQSDPATFVVRLEADGYLPQRREITVTDTGFVGVTVEMLSPARPPVGVVVQQQPAASDASGQTTQPTTVSASNTSSSDGSGSATVTIPQGTTLQDASGAALTGAIEFEVSSIDPNSDAVATLPDDGNSVRLGAVSLRATVGGKQAASGNKQTEVAFQIAESAVNPETGNPFAPGDVIALRRYDEAAGSWVDAGTATVGAGKQTRSVTASVTAFGLYAPVTRSVLASILAPMQTVTVTVDRNGNEEAFEIAVAGSGYARSQAVSSGSGVAHATFLGLPMGDRRYARAVFNGVVYAAADQQTCTDCRITLPAPVPPVTIEIAPTCAVSGRQVFIDSLPSFTVSVREQGTSQWVGLGKVTEIVRRANGSLEQIVKVTRAMRSGVTYDVRAAYLEETFRDTYAVASDGSLSESFQVSAGLCK